MASQLAHTGQKSQSRRIAACAALLLSISASACFAQQAAEAQGSAEPEARQSTRRVGDATNDLLNLQASGTAAGKNLPMLGATTESSWQRYQESFKFKIPESFVNKVQSPSN
jgi:hypothetical protein